eukprot:9718645-Alexandrium_andersonii.AAC.1
MTLLVASGVARSRSSNCKHLPEPLDMPTSIISAIAGSKKTTSAQSLNCRSSRIAASGRSLNCAGPGTDSALIPEAPE